MLIKYMIFAFGMALRTISALRDLLAYSRIFKDIQGCAAFSVINLCLASVETLSHNVE